MYEGLINNLHRAADKWEREHPIIGVGQLRVHDALRDAARALKEADCKIEQVTLERDAAVQDIKRMVHDNTNTFCYYCEMAKGGCEAVNCRGRNAFEWRGVTKEDTNDQ